MQNKYSEVFVMIVAGAVLALLLVGFIVSILVTYKKKQYQHEQELLHARLEIQESIFKNLSEEIHDNIGQVLSVLKLTLSAISSVENENDKRFLLESKDMVNHITNSISDLSKSLHTDRIVKIGIVEAVRAELNKIAKTNLFETVYLAADCNYTLNPEKEIFLFRIIQEILNNIIKHSHAKTIKVHFYCTDKQIVFTFADDGVGFDLKEAFQKSSSTRGIGLSSMMNRSRIMGGNLTINTEPGKGTVTTIEIPASIIANPAENNHKKSNHA
jgi:two-component system, NarL family, sensor kinase